MSRFEAVEVDIAEVHPVKEMADECRSLYPLSQREVPGNVLQDLFRKAKQVYILQ